MKISDFPILSGWIEKYKPALSKSDSSWNNSYCVRLVIFSLAGNIGKLQSLVSEDNFSCWVYNDFCSDFLLLQCYRFCKYVEVNSIALYNEKSLKELLYTQQKKLSSLTRDYNLPIFTAKYISLISRNTNYSRKNLIYLKQVYTFRSNQTKLENPKSSLPLKKFIVHFLTTLNPRKWKVR